MKLEFRSQMTILAIDFENKTYHWAKGFNENAYLMPTIKEMKELEKELIKNGFVEVE